MLDNFPANRLNDLWRGLGIAITYVGGCSQDYLQVIFEKGSTFQIDLATGAAMTLISREEANSITTDAILTCKVLCNKNADQILTIAIDSNVGDKFSQWIKNLEVAFTNK